MHLSAVLRILLATSIATASALATSPLRADDFIVIPVSVGAKGTVPVEDVVELRVRGIDALIDTDERLDLRRGDNDGDDGDDDFVVPAGRVFVMTSVMATPVTVGTGFNVIYVIQRNGGRLRTRRQLIMRTDSTMQMTFTPGIVFQAGSELSVENRANSATAVRIDVTGYLADAR